MKYSVEGLLAGLLAAALLLPGAARAERSDREKPMQVEADAVRMDDLQKVAVYEGKVVLSQGTLWLAADRVEVRQDEQGFGTGVATGQQVRFRQKLDGRQEWVEGWANRIEYDARRELLRLIGQARLQKGEEELRGELITYDARSELYQASGVATPGKKPGRVRAVILPPRSAKEDSGAASAAGKP
ncbi:MAG: lipopolysaccharide transport periplasmic protein LptA [Thiobacillaceae bacterium]|jgi:lipopolysaccharide export system protein LptA|nr:lipopolysaccharide transport periplasmic protein LptA [Thiobacillaceae bacterium]